MCKCLLCIYLTCFCYQMDNSLNLHKVTLLQLYLLEYQSADCYLCISNFNFNILIYFAQKKKFPGKIKLKHKSITFYSKTVQ